MRVLVTGGQGCIGAWVVKDLLGRGAEVLTYDSEPDPSRLSMLVGEAKARAVPAITGRIEDTARLKTLVREEGVTHIVHLAAVLMPFCQANPVEGGLINVVGTLNIFEAARDAGRPVRIVYASSSAVYGPGESYGGRKVSEQDTSRPTTHYGIFKQANEENARVFFAQDGISSIGLRPWTVYGVGRDRGLTADPTLAMKAVVEGRPFEIRVSGFMDLQYVGDVAGAFVGCLLSGLTGAQVFALAGDIVAMPELVTLLERMRPGASSLISVTGPQIPVAYDVDDSGIRSSVPGLPRTTLEDGVRQTLEHFEALQRDGRLPAG